MTVDEEYALLFASLTQEEQVELFEIKFKFNTILDKQRKGLKVTNEEQEWILTRPHYISSDRLGVDLIEGELIYLK